MAQFHETRRGQKFFDHDVPKIADSLHQLVNGLGQLSDPLKELVSEIDRLSSAAELGHDVGKAFCDVEGCEEHAVRCENHLLFAEEVWIVRGPADEMRTFATMQVAKEYMAQVVQPGTSEEIDAWGLDKPETRPGEWSVGPFRVYRQPVEILA